MWHDFMIKISFINVISIFNVSRGLHLKTIKVSDDVHRKLTQLLGEQMAKTGKSQTYNDILEILLTKLPGES
jgi:hypothetical protein